MNEPTVHIAIGIDCDYPRGNYFYTEEGTLIARDVFETIQRITELLPQLGISFTYFVCGTFLEDLKKRYGRQSVRDAFISGISDAIEIGDHTYSHRPLIEIPTRKDKVAIPPNELAMEYHRNSDLFAEVFGIDLARRGFRAPLGHYRGLQGHEEIQEILYNCGVKYVSTDLRDRQHSIHPPLVDLEGNGRYPYAYPTGLLEIPIHGWQDTAFFGYSKTPLYEASPETYQDILTYFYKQVNRAKQIAITDNRHFILGLALHPFNIHKYGHNGLFFRDLTKIADVSKAIFCQYSQVEELIKKGNPK